MPFFESSSDSISDGGHHENSQNGQAVSNHVSVSPAGPGSVQYRCDLAYWRQVLRSAPCAAPLEHRRRALSPAGLGRNRGEMGFLDAAIAGASLHERPNPGADLMTAFVRTLRTHYALDSLVLDRWFTDRGEERAYALGPLDSFYPVVLPSVQLPDEALAAAIERSDRLGHAHRGLDTPALLNLLKDDLRRCGIALQQFGFAFIDTRDVPVFTLLGSPLDAVPATPHEIQCAAALDNAELRVRLAVDLEIVSKSDAEAAFALLLAELAKQIGLAERLEPLCMGWTTRTWPRIALSEEAAPEPAATLNIANAEREIPVTSTQSALLRFQDHPDATPYARSAFSGSKAWIVHPAMDLDRLNRSAEKIRERHEVMRLRFFRNDPGYGAYLEREPSQIVFTEQADSEAEALQRAKVLAAQWIDIDEAMFRITLIRSPGGDLIFAMGHHLVTDGYSIGLFLEETISAYLGLPLPEIRMDIDRYIREYDHVGKPGSFERRDAYLRNLFADPPPLPQIGRKAKGLRPNVDIVDCAAGLEAALMLPPDQEAVINAHARAAGVSPMAMLVGAFAQTIGTLGGVDDLIIQVPAGLRHSYRLENYANFVASDVPVRLRLADAANLAHLAATVSESVNAAMEFAPFMDSNYFGDLHDEVVAQGSYTSLFVAGDRTVERWMRQTASAALQDVFATDQIDLGMFKVTPVPDLRDARPAISELDLRRFAVGAGLRLTIEYDTLGYTADEADGILQDIVSRLMLPG